VEAAALEQSRILIVDDQASNVMLLEKVLAAAGFTSVSSTTDSAQVLLRFAELEPDIVLLDLQMPPPDGFEVMRLLQTWTTGQAPLPILVLTADNTRETKTAALAHGASDFLTKPFDRTEVVLRVRNLLTTRLLQVELRDQNVILEHRVSERTRELEQARYEVIDRLALAAEYRDDETGEHTRRVAWLSALLAEHLGLPAASVELIRRAAPLHDVGKISVSDTILLKPGKLTPHEFEAMKIHTIVGGSILGRSQSELLRMSEQIALSHHEWWDGSGYPHRLKGDQIPLPARIVAVADVFDALTNRRPYKEPWPLEQALAEIEQLKGRQFDAWIVDTLLALSDKLASAAPGNRRVA
jgi:putative two-component system response regulator